MSDITPSEYKYTVICWDVHDGVLKPYIRLCPDFIVNEGWGFSFGHFYDTEEEAILSQMAYEEYFADLFRKVFDFAVESCYDEIMNTSDRYRKEYFADKIKGLVK